MRRRRLERDRHLPWLPRRRGRPAHRRRGRGRGVARLRPPGGVARRALVRTRRRGRPDRRRALDLRRPRLPRRRPRARVPPRHGPRRVQGCDGRRGARRLPRPRADGRHHPRPRALARTRPRARPRRRPDPRRPQRAAATKTSPKRSPASSHHLRRSDLVTTCHKQFLETELTLRRGDFGGTIERCASRVTSLPAFSTRSTTSPGVAFHRGDQPARRQGGAAPWGHEAKLRARSPARPRGSLPATRLCLGT